MRELLKKAAPVFLVLLALYVLGYAAGYISGKQGWVDYKDIQDPPVLKFSRNLEYNVPGYSYLLKQYKAWHDNGRTAYLLQKNAWGLGTLIFVNNFFMANLTMAIRALFVMPVSITILGKFFRDPARGRPRRPEALWAGRAAIRGGDPGRKHPRDPAHHELFLSIRRVR